MGGGAARPWPTSTTVLQAPVGNCVGLTAHFPTVSGRRYAKARHPASVANLPHQQDEQRGLAVHDVDALSAGRGLSAPAEARCCCAGKGLDSVLGERLSRQDRRSERCDCAQYVGRNRPMTAWGRPQLRPTCRHVAGRGRARRSTGERRAFRQSCSATRERSQSPAAVRPLLPVDARRGIAACC